MAYQYDVFFSYKRLPLAETWTKKVIDMLRFYLALELGVERVAMFVDQEEIQTGDVWPDRLRRALKSSKCLVCVWSPLYFQSGWCTAEWRSFLARQKTLGDGACALIAPLKYHDGKSFPEEAREVQWTDVSQYTLISAGFWQRDDAVCLEEVLREFAVRVAEMIRQAPPYQEDWPIVEPEPSRTPILLNPRL